MLFSDHSISLGKQNTSARHHVPTDVHADQEVGPLSQPDHCLAFRAHLQDDGELEILIPAQQQVEQVDGYPISDQPPQHHAPHSILELRLHSPWLPTLHG